MLPAKLQPIEDWAAPRSVKNLQQFLGFAEKLSAVLGLRRKASRTFSSSWAAPRSVKSLQQFLGFAEKRQEPSAVLGLR
jgi:hypothetical protein